MLIVDSGPSYADRYTLVNDDGACFGFGSNPFHPQGFGQYVGDLGQAVSVEYLETQEEIELKDLPEQAQRFVQERL